MHPDNVISIAPQANEDWVMEIRRQNYAITEITCDVIREVYAEFEKNFGRKYGNPFFEEYMTEDADVVLLGMGTMSTPVKVAIRKLREARQESWLCAAALVPAISRSRDRQVLGTLQGNRRNRSRLLVRFTQSQRRRSHGSSLGDVYGQQPPAASHGLHRRFGRP